MNLPISPDFIIIKIKYSFDAFDKYFLRLFSSVYFNNYLFFCYLFSVDEGILWRVFSFVTVTHDSPLLGAVSHKPSKVSYSIHQLCLIRHLYISSCLCVKKKISWCQNWWNRWNKHFSSIAFGYLVIRLSISLCWSWTHY